MCAYASCSCELGYETETVTKDEERKEKWSLPRRHGGGIVAQGLKTNESAKMEEGEERRRCPRDGNDTFRVLERGCHHGEIGVVM